MLYADCALEITTLVLVRLKKRAETLALLGRSWDSVQPAQLWRDGGSKEALSTHSLSLGLDKYISGGSIGRNNIYFFSRIRIIFFLYLQYLSIIIEINIFIVKF